MYNTCTYIQPNYQILFRFPYLEFRITYMTYTVRGGIICMECLTITFHQLTRPIPPNTFPNPFHVRGRSTYMRLNVSYSFAHILNALGCTSSKNGQVAKGLHWNIAPCLAHQAYCLCPNSTTFLDLDWDLLGSQVEMAVHKSPRFHILPCHCRPPPASPAQSFLPKVWVLFLPLPPFSVFYWDSQLPPTGTSLLQVQR